MAVVSGSHLQSILPQFKLLNICYAFATQQQSIGNGEFHTFYPSIESITMHIEVGRLSIDLLPMTW
jgi:hypothetical protein